MSGDDANEFSYKSSQDTMRKFKTWAYQAIIFLQSRDGARTAAELTSVFLPESNKLVIS